LPAASIAASTAAQAGRIALRYPFGRAAFRVLFVSVETLIERPKMQHPCGLPPDLSRQVREQAARVGSKAVSR
jgi:hypothetical protein